MASTRGERLRAARAKRFASARSAAIALGIPVSTYGAHERAEAPGGRDFSPEEAKRYAKRFGVRPEWLMTGHRATADEADELADVPAEPRHSPPTRLSVSGYVGPSLEAHFYAVAPEDLEEIAAPALATQSTVGLEIRGTSLGSQFERWYVLFDGTGQPMTPRDLIGKTCVVGLDDDRVLIKQLRKAKVEGRFDLISNVGPAIRNVRVLWAVKVKAIVAR